MNYKSKGFNIGLYTYAVIVCFLIAKVLIFPPKDGMTAFAYIFFYAGSFIVLLVIPLIGFGIGAIMDIGKAKSGNSVVPMKLGIKRPLFTLVTFIALIPIISILIIAALYIYAKSL